MASAYLLVAHGSRDPRPEIAMHHLAGLLCRQIQAYSPTVANASVASPPKCDLVGTAYLELRPEPLHEQIRKFGKQVVSLGCHSLKIIPLFLLPGVHVMEDIPAEVAIAQQCLAQDIKIYLQPHLGSSPDLVSLLMNRWSATTADAKILLSHGSRRSGSQEAVEAIAVALNAVAAFWAHSPSLESRVQELVSAGYREIAILPYFLFAGGITDAVADTQQKLKLQFKNVSFQLAEPLGASAELANLIWELMEK